MKAIVYTKQGPPEVLQLKEIEKPLPKNNEVLVKIYCATVTAGDVLLRKLPLILTLIFGIFGMKRRKIPGVEFSGVIESIGKDVTVFKVGDRVFGTTTGLSSGANAEYVCIPNKWKMGVIGKIVEGVSFDDAAALPVGGMTALYLLHKANIQKGQHILIYGASGSVGTYAVQLAKYFGAEVTGMCSTRNLELVRSIGADHVIDYKKENFTENGQKYNIIFDTVRKIHAKQCRESLKPNGVFITVRSPTKEMQENLDTLIQLVKSGEIKPVIDRKYSISKVQEAHEYVETGRKKGNVIIKIMDER
jgi:NADPH:quinone reductase-like Zn-dependent oxidoreductase